MNNQSVNTALLVAMQKKPSASRMRSSSVSPVLEVEMKHEIRSSNTSCATSCFDHDHVSGFLDLIVNTYSIKHIHAAFAIARKL